MRRATLALLLAAVAATLALAPAASADFGFEQFDGSFVEKDGSTARQAGSHPYAVQGFFILNHHEEESKPALDGGQVKDLILESPRGFTGNATAVPRCAMIDFVPNGTKSENSASCDDSTAVGATAAFVNGTSEALPAPIYNLVPPPGVPVRLGFVTGGVPVVIDVQIKDSPDYNVIANTLNIPQQPVYVFGAAFEIWGTPADHAHDFMRGTCLPTALPELGEIIVGGKLNPHEGGPTCDANTTPVPFLTLPRTCTGPPATNYRLDSWALPGIWLEGSLINHDNSIPPVPAGFIGCGKLDFAPSISSKATADSAGAATGLDFSLDFADEGLLSPKAGAIAGSDLKKAVVTLPEGITVNPSIGEGLGVCTFADLARETLASAPGEGCPNSSKIGTVSVDTPLVDEAIEGSVFLAQQNDPATAAKENPFDTDIAFYIVLRNKNLGVLVKVPAKVTPDPKTGQLVTTVDDIPGFPVPETPFSHFDFHFREGQRAPLITPSHCGTYTTTAELTPRARPEETITKTATFQITSGIGGGPCPPGGIPPFKPGFEAGSLNNNAGSYSPFEMRLTRADGEQDMTKFSAILPPGVLGKLAGVDKCPEAQIALAKTKSGRAEIASPSCPANSLIGHTVAGAGVGAALTYVPGQLYLAGPYKGDPLSVVAITPAVAGPFDVGTVLVRVALTLNSKTGEVEVDGAASDPIPHILRGIVLDVRDLRVHVDRPNFTLNPTSCDKEKARATLFGSYRDVFSPADDVPVALATRYQASNCSRLGFKPKLSLQLKGGTERGDHPSLHAVLRARAGDANIEGAVVRLPRSAFLDQGHIRTICTRVQFAADNCPKGAIYGHVKAFTPLLSEPLEGPAYLRSSNHNLPDLVFDLHGIVDVEASARIDSKNGGIRTTFTEVPDAPISKVIVDMQGGKKGLIVNSTNLCAHEHKANVLLEAHNGASRGLHPLMQARCRRG